MTDLPDHIKQQIDADVARITSLFRMLAEKCWESSIEDNETNFRFDTLGVVGIAAWTDEDGVDREDSVSSFESRRHHVVTGILTDLQAARMQRTHL